MWCITRACGRTCAVLWSIGTPRGPRNKSPKQSWKPRAQTQRHARVVKGYRQATKSKMRLPHTFMNPSPKHKEARFSAPPFAAGKMRGLGAASAPLGVAPSNTCSDVSVMAADLAASLSQESVVRINESLAKRTTLRVGGPADL